MYGLCRDLFGEVGLVSRRVLRCRVSVGTCTARFFFVETCSESSAYCWDMSGDVGFVSGLVRRGRLSVATCSTK